MVSELQAMLLTDTESPKLLTDPSLSQLQDPYIIFEIFKAVAQAPVQYAPTTVSYAPQVQYAP